MVGVLVVNFLGSSDSGLCAAGVLATFFLLSYIFRGNFLTKSLVFIKREKSDGRGKTKEFIFYCSDSNIFF